MKTSKELADELDAEDRLFARGYTKEQCTHCKGSGSVPDRASVQAFYNICPHCEGQGYHWKAPITK